MNWLHFIRHACTSSVVVFFIELEQRKAHFQCNKNQQNDIKLFMAKITLEQIEKNDNFHTQCAFYLK